MRPINVDKSLIQHNIIMRVKYIVAVPASLCQEVCNHRAEHAGLLMHGKHGLSLMYFTNYQTHIPLIAAFQEYHNFAKTDGTDTTLLFVKSESYPVDLVQPRTKLVNIEMRFGDYLYMCTTTGLDCKQRKAHGGLRQMRRLGR
jgi:hypothetical protein